MPVLETGRWVEEQKGEAVFLCGFGTLVQSIARFFAHFPLLAQPVLENSRL